MELAIFYVKGLNRSKFLKIPTQKINEKLHKNVNENMFSFTFYAIFHASVTGIFD